MGDQLDELVAQIRAAGGRALAVVCDVTDPVSVATAHARIVAEQGPVEIAFLNAGVGDRTTVKEFDAARVRRLFEVNLFGVAHWLEALFAPMREAGRGTIAVTSSLAAARGLPGSGAYSASKAALSTLLESLQADARRYGILLSIVEPGFIRTPMTAKHKFKMPFLLDPPEAARLMVEGVAEGQPLIRFPWQMAATMQLIRHLPGAIFEPLGRRMLSKRD